MMLSILGVRMSGLKRIPGIRNELQAWERPNKRLKLAARVD